MWMAPLQPQQVSFPLGERMDLRLHGRAHSFYRTDHLNDNLRLTSDAATTALVVHQPAPRERLGEFLFAKLPPVSDIEVQIPEIAGYHLAATTQTKRPPHTPYGRVGARFGYRKATLDRHGIASELDADFGLYAEGAARRAGIPLQLREMHARLALLVMHNSIEVERARVALDPNNYGPGMMVTLAPGSEFNDPAGGDARSVVKLLASQIARVAGRRARTSVAALATQAAWDALVEDPRYLAWRQAVQDRRNPSGEQAAEYLGIKSLRVTDSDVLDDPEDPTSLRSLYGDAFFLYLEPMPSDLLPGMEVRLAWAELTTGPQVVAPCLLRESEELLIPVKEWTLPYPVSEGARAVILNTNKDL